MSISSVGLPTTQQVPELMWATGPDATERHEPRETVAEVKASPDTGVVVTSAPRVAEPADIRAALPEGQGRVVDRTV
ncbi:hypothetical protein [Blastochloris viridis]|uniref:Uncharacterized protein n=1 Tax=Blastochloris viridis TaxID=1079 RepID=A0A0H5BFA8_BLAVI|nr:hypothetical protein [Blastochloris viridis]ALK10273.1 hypothetical protein BVIR_2507 [Blastochloris viridis]BAR99794.1 hypothetical protein BV133_2201 [Blastochloris viridis]CUU42935.1 hypothetical protein BVIRIDIS_19510 [Blastochloris viridis]